MGGVSKISAVDCRITKFQIKIFMCRIMAHVGGMRNARAFPAINSILKLSLAEFKEKPSKNAV